VNDSAAFRPTPLRILVTSWRDVGHPEAGGAEVFLEEVTSRLADRGHHVTVVTARYPGSLPSQARGDRLFVRSGGRYSVYPRGFLHAARNRRNYDVVLDIANGVPFWTPLTAGAPVVCVVHHVHREQWAEVFKSAPSKLGWWLESVAAPKIYRNSSYLAVSEATKAELANIGVDPRRVKVVYSGVEALTPEKRLHDNLHEVRMVSVGRLVPHKRLEIAIRTVKELSSQVPEVSLTIAGGGYWEEELRTFAASIGVTDRVRFAGVVSEQEKANLLAEASVHLMPSLKEGWGLVIIEAGTVGTPSVAFRSAGGTAESIIDGQTGVLADTEAEFIEAVRSIVTKRELRESLGANALRHSGQFNWSATTDAIEESLLAKVGLGPIKTSAAPRQRPRSKSGKFRATRVQIDD